ncbi:uncharacterized protein LOC106011237 [Aplysia californica]|uniref:Uncharacterized protein LOC106011237 n=1 Tax=Aplysia californica TaxID=6500 RepID=A0ABM1VQA2_APLCA|nr:uncharacterized protein LOC106011237 [Aplysia californica]
MQFIKKGRFENPDDDSTDEVKVQLANHSARLEKQSQLLQTALETIQHLAERLETQTTKSSLGPFSPLVVDQPARFKQHKL